MFRYIVPALFLLGVVSSNREIYEKIPRVDIDEVLTNDAVLQHHFDCVMDRRGCPDLIDEIKEIVPEIIRTNCGMCTEEEKEAVRRVTTHVRQNKPEMWEEFSDRYDPERNFKL